MTTIRQVQDPAEVAPLCVSDSTYPGVSPDRWTQAGSMGLVAADEEGSPVGAILLLPDRQVAARVISFRVAWLYAKKSSRRMGIATRLLKEAAGRAARVGVNRIHVDISSGNPGCLELFDHLGSVSGAAYVICLKRGGL